MSHPQASIDLHNESHCTTLSLSGNWLQGDMPSDLLQSQAGTLRAVSGKLVVDGSRLGDWDSVLVAFLLHCHDSCRDSGAEFETRTLPEGVEQLLDIATAVAPLQDTSEDSGGPSWLSDPLKRLQQSLDGLLESLTFIGDVVIALSRLIRGKANTRVVDFWTFCYQAGPDAFAIISLTSVLIGMILAYLGAVQLQQFGAEIYVADLVVIGMLREMGVLMAAIVMAGRTGAAFAAQLGTMQTNDEIDAITTMGISPIEFLVLPRMLALIAVMPLLTIYADILGMFGGSMVAYGMGISPTQYILESESAFAFVHVSVGLIKSIVFGTLIAIAGCRAGINSGRSSAAVGEAATTAVVTAIVYLIVADAGINIIFQQLDM